MQTRSTQIAIRLSRQLSLAYVSDAVEGEHLSGLDAHHANNAKKVFYNKASVYFIAFFA